MPNAAETRLRVLVLSSVLPFPGESGQEQRVAYMLRALRQRFHVTLLTVSRAGRIPSLRETLREHADEVEILPSLQQRNTLSMLVHGLAARVYSAWSGLKTSNYQIGLLEFSPARLRRWLRGRTFDLAVYEYWHAAASVPVLHDAGIPCVLDMHNILWKVVERRLPEQARVPAWWADWSVARYRAREENAWRKFDALIAINRAEYRAAEAVVPPEIKMFHAPMGIDLSRWSSSWDPAVPPRLMYYGGLASRHNQQDALRCYRGIMPRIWREFPDAQLWLVGSNPPDAMTHWPDADARVHVSGYVRDVQSVLASAALLLCPWSGTYGFRSRLIEAMALGLPVVASPEAVDGMDLEDGQGLLLRASDHEMAEAALSILKNETIAKSQSRLARAQVDSKFTFESTYLRLADELAAFAADRKAKHTI